MLTFADGEENQDENRGTSHHYYDENHETRIKLSEDFGSAIGIN
jgi:hypothetical protein